MDFIDNKIKYLTNLKEYKSKLFLFLINILEDDLKLLLIDFIFMKLFCLTLNETKINVHVINLL